MQAPWCPLLRPLLALGLIMLMGCSLLQCHIFARKSWDSVTMNLLPKTHKEFASEDYWNKFFKQRGAKAFEWYGEYGELCGIIHKYMKQTDKVLVVGCGNSRLSADMYDVGYQNIINVDISDVVIGQMTQAHAKSRPNMSFIKMDILNMQFEDNSFSVVLDKGTLDALMTDDSAEVRAKVAAMFSEITRVLKLGGRYVCVSLAQEHVIQMAVNYFADQGWPVRVCRVFQENDDEGEFRMPVFVYVFTKFKKLPNMNPILEVVEFEEKVNRVNSIDEVLQSVKAMQYYGIVRQQLNTRDKLDESLNLELYSPDSTDPRYTLYVVNNTVKTPNKFAIFIVPEGREREWMFATEEGRDQLAMSAGFQRLGVVCLHPRHTYANLDQVKAELSSKVMELAPPGVHSAQVPFLSLGEDINKRTIVQRGTSSYSGDFVVEEVEVDGCVNRQLVFLNTRSIIQSQARLVPEQNKKKGRKAGKKLHVDLDHLSEAHHAAMVGGLALMQNACLGDTTKCVVVGLGGGGLVSFLHRHIPQMHIDAVELDEAIFKVAQDWFGLTVDNTLKVHIQDGVQFINAMAEKGEEIDVLIIDVDNKDNSIGISSPPRAFLDYGLLNNIHKLLKPTGIFILNLCCRDRTLRKSILEDLKKHFKEIYTKSIPEHINEVLYGFHRDRDSMPEILASQLPQTVTDTLKQLQTSMSSKNCNVNLVNSLRGLRLE